MDVLERFLNKEHKVVWVVKGVGGDLGKRLNMIETHCTNSQRINIKLVSLTNRMEENINISDS